MGEIFPILSILVINWLHKQFINHIIWGGGTPGMTYITNRDFVVIAIFFRNNRQKQYDDHFT